MSINVCHTKFARLLIIFVLLTILLALSGCGSSEESATVPTLVQLPETAMPEILPSDSPPEVIQQPTEAAPTEVVVLQQPVEVPLSVANTTAIPPAQTTAPAPIVIPASEPIIIPPIEIPVPNQVVIIFSNTATDEERAAYVESIGGAVKQDIEGLNTVVVSVPDDVTLETLPESEAVAASEPDYYAVAFQEQPVDDPYYPQQWALPVIGAPDAWAEIPVDAPQITVAVIDSGICLEHPDLAGRILPGYDFVEDDTTPQDDFGHGCGVSGIIASNTNNNTGMAGVAPNAMILPLRVLDASGIGTYSDVAAAIVYATDNGAQIINLSLGGPNPSTTLQNAIDYAVAHDVMVIAAAGNSGQPYVLYPAAYEPVIAVGSVDSDLQQSSFSNYGPDIDLWAPGRDILTATNSNGYSTMSGTSFAAPHVSGQQALELAGVIFNPLDTPTPAIDPTTQPTIAPEPTFDSDELSYDLPDWWPSEDEVMYTTGPISPLTQPGVNAQYLARWTVIANVPPYIWRHGCAPTSAGMVLGYYDRRGFGALVPGDAAIQTPSVNGMIANEDHYNDYSYPEDTFNNILPDKSELPVGDEHTSNSIADFMKTSFSIDAMPYGYGYIINAPTGITQYVQSVAPEYTATAQYHTWGSLTWENFKAEIDASHPVVLAVDTDDTDGLANPNHAVTAVGYGYDDNDTPLYGVYTTWDNDIHWYEFRQMAPDRAWGIHGGIFISITAQHCEAVYPYDGVILYKDVQCSNASGQLQFDTPEYIRALSDWGFNDAVHSIHVGSGWSVRIWDDNDKQGSTRCITGPMWDLTVDDYDDGFPIIKFDGTPTISSIEIFNNSDCSDSSEPPPDPPPSTNDTTPPTGSWNSPSDWQTIYSSNVTLSVYASDSGGSGVREVRFSAKWGGNWYGIGTASIGSPYNFTWNWCSNEVPNGDVELGMEVWDYANNVWIYSQHYTNMHINKSYNCPQDPVDPPLETQGVYLWDQVGQWGNGLITWGDQPSLGVYLVAGGPDNWNDHAQSTQVVGNFHYVAYWDDNYSGDHITGNGTSDLGSWREQISSVRVRRSDNAAFSIYSLGDYNGEVWHSDRTIYDLGHWDKNDWAQSMRVYSGYEIIACEHSNFEGRCGRATGPANFSDINSLSQGLRDGVSSVRVCSGSCPPSASPPTLTYPLNGQIINANNTVSLQWYGGGTTYYAELWGGALGSTQTYGWTTSNQWDVGTLTASASPYYWHVKAQNGFGESGWATGSFYVQPPTVKVDNVFITDEFGTSAALGADIQPILTYHIDDGVSANAITTNFNAGDAIRLYIEANNNTGTTQTAHFTWTVTDPAGRDVPALSWEGDLSTDNNNLYWYLSSSVPPDAITGTYQFTGEIDYNGDITQQTTTFNVTGPNTVEAIRVYTTDGLGAASLGITEPMQSDNNELEAAAYQYDYYDGDAIQLHFQMWNNQLSNVDADLVWDVTDPNGNPVASLNYQGTHSISPGSADWYLSQTFNAYYVTGRYTFTASATYNGQTKSASTTFFVYSSDLPANDLFANAYTISAPTETVTQNVVGATVSVDDPAVSCIYAGDYQYANNVWYSFTPGVNQVIDISTAGSEYDTVLAVYTGADLASLAASDCNDDSNSTLQSHLQFYGQTGVTYYIMVSKYGSYRLSAPTNITLTLDTLSTISGTIYETDGTTLITTGAWVEALDANTGNWIDSTSVNPDGTYTLILPPGDYRVNAMGNGLAREFYNEVGPDYWAATPVTVVANNDTPGIDFNMDPGGNITATVYDEGGTTPLENVPVFFHNTWGSWSLSCTNASGQATYYGYPYGEEMRVQASNMQSGSSYYCSGNAGPYVAEYWDEVTDYDSATPITLSDLTPDANISFTLQLGGTVSGTVYDTNMTALPGVEVVINGDGFWEYTCTDANGHYHFLGIPHNSSFRVIAAEGFNRCGGSSDYVEEFWQEAIDWNDATLLTVNSGNLDFTGIDFTLELGGEISGTVHQDNGTTPIEHVRVVATGGGYWFDTCTDTNGDYHLHGMPFNIDLQVMAGGSGNWCNDGNSPQDYLREWWQEAANDYDATLVTLSTGTTSRTGIDFTLSQASSISGTVYDTDGTTPLSTAGLWLRDADNNWLQGTNVNPDGTYLFHVPAGDYKVFAYEFDNNYAAEFYNNAGPFRDNATIVPVAAVTDVTGINFTLAAAGSISGTITDSTGSPLPMTIRISIDDLGWGWCQEVSDGTAFTFRGLTINETYTISAGGEGCDDPGTYIKEWWNDSLNVEGATSITLTDAIPDATGVVFELDRAGTVSGTVYEVDGITPVANMTVATYADDFYSSACTDANGNYTLVAIPHNIPFRVSTTIESNWCGGSSDYVEEFWQATPYWGDATLLTVTNSNLDITGIDFTIELGGRLSGTVYQTDGTTTIGDMQIVAEGDGYYYEACADSNGNYMFYGLPFDVAWQIRAGGNDNWCNDNNGPTNYVYEWWNESNHDSSSTLTTLTSGSPNQTGINFTLDPGGSISGTVSADGGSGLDSVWICAFTYSAAHFDEAVWNCDQIQADGTYLITALPPFDQRIWVFPDDRLRLFYDGSPTGSITFEGAIPVGVVANVETTGINLALPSAQVISGMVYDKDGVTPLSSVTISTENGEYPECSQSDGSYRIFVRSGTYTIKASDGICYSNLPDFATQYYNGTINSGEATPVNATLGDVSDIDFTNLYIADISVTNTAAAQIIAGRSMIYSIVVTNNGSDNANNLVVTDTLPNGVTVSNITPSLCNQTGQTITCNLGVLDSGNSTNISILVAVDLATSGDIINNVNVTANEQDTNMDNNNASVTTNVIPVEYAFITEQELQTQLQTQIDDHPEWDMDFALVDLVPGGMNFTIRVTDGTVGNVSISVVQNTDGYVAMQITNITVDGTYADTINQELMPLIINSLDTLIVQTVGENHNLESMTITDMQINATFVSSSP